MEDERRQLASGLEHGGIQADAGQLDQLLNWLALLERWNRVFNLTAVTPPQRITQLVLMSAAAVPYLHGSRILDVGSGAGVPGIPLAILARGGAYTLLDSSGRKARFIRQSRLELKLDNVSVAQSRVEQFNDGKYDTIISRAFAGLREFVAATRHLGGVGSRWLAYRRAAVHGEAAARPADDMVCEARPIALPGLRTRNRLLIMRMK